MGWPSPPEGLQSGPERIQTLRYGYPNLQNGSGVLLKFPQRFQDASEALPERTKCFKKLPKQSKIKLPAGRVRNYHL